MNFSRAYIRIPVSLYTYIYPRAYIRIHRYIVDRRLFIPLLSLISSASRARFFTATPFLPLEYAYVYTLYTHTHTSTIIPLCIYIYHTRAACASVPKLRAVLHPTRSLLLFLRRVHLSKNARIVCDAATAAVYTRDEDKNCSHTRARRFRGFVFLFFSFSLILRELSDNTGEVCACICIVNRGTENTVYRVFRYTHSI